MNGTSVYRTRPERESILYQFIVHIQYGGTISRNHHAGGSIAGIILHPSGACFILNGRIIAVHRDANRSSISLRVIVHERRRCASVIILFKHVNDSDINVFRLPLGIDRGIAFNMDSAAGSLSQLLIQIPASKGIAGTGRNSGRDRRISTIGIGTTADIAAAVGFIGELEVLAGVIDIQFLAARLRNVRTLGALKRSILKRLDRRGNKAAQNALNGRFPINFSVAFTGEILQLVHEVIHSGKRYILETNGGFLIRIKIGFGYFNYGSSGVICSGSLHLLRIGISAGRGSDGVRRLKLSRLHLDQVRIENYFITAVIQIVVFCCDFINLHRVEHSNNYHVLSNDGIRIDFGLRAIINDPLIKDLARNERILRHGADSFAVTAEILRKALDHGFPILDNEGYRKLFAELGNQREIRSDLLTAGVLRFSDIPARKVLAFHNRVVGQGQGIAGIIGIGMIGFFILIAQLKGDSEDILFVFRPYAGIRGNSHGVGKVATRIDPLAGVTFLGRNRRNVIEAVGSIGVDSFCINNRRFIFLIEGYGVGDQIVVGNDRSVLGRNECVINTILNGCGTMVINGTHSPVGSIILAGDGGGQLIANGLTLHHINHLINLRVTVIEGDRPGFRSGLVPVLFLFPSFVTSSAKRLGRRITGLDGYRPVYRRIGSKQLVIRGVPTVKHLAFFFRRRR